VKAFLKEKNAQWEADFPKDPEPESPPAMEGMAEGEGMGMAEGEEVMAEGGDEGMAAMMAAEDLYKDDSAAYDGSENLPALILRCCVVHPYFGDLVKRDVISAEFNPKPKHEAFKDAAVIYGLAVDAAEGEEKDFHFSGYLGALDVESIKGIPENGPIMFPGVVAGWATEEEALKVFNADLHAKNEVKKVCFHTKTKVVSAVVCRLFAYRFNAKVEKQEDKDGVLHVTLADDSWEHKTLEAWNAWKEEMKKKAEEEAAAAAAAAAAAGAEKAEDEAMKAAENAGGEGAGEEPPKEE